MVAAIYAKPYRYQASISFSSVATYDPNMTFAFHEIIELQADNITVIPVSETQLATSGFKLMWRCLSRTHIDENR